jgi:Ca2+-dependent lipid-binding protein
MGFSPLRLQVTIIQAEGLPTSHVFGVPNYYCVIRLDNSAQTFRTFPIKGDSSPIWDHTTSMEVLDLNNPLIINLRSRNTIFNDTDIGSAHILLKEIPTDDESITWYNIKPATGVRMPEMRLKVGLLLGIPRLFTTSIIVLVPPQPLPGAMRSPV